MKVWRLHAIGAVLEGPYRNGCGAPTLERLLADHKTPYLHIEALENAGDFDAAELLYSAFHTARHDGWIYGWSTEDQMLRYVPNSSHWDNVLRDYEVSVLEATDFYVMPDGQVMFNPNTATATGEAFHPTQENDDEG